MENSDNLTVKNMLTVEHYKNYLNNNNANVAYFLADVSVDLKCTCVRYSND